MHSNLRALAKYAEFCSHLVQVLGVLRFEHTDDGPVLDHSYFQI
jgi:hypothetical protein